MNNFFSKTYLYPTPNDGDQEIGVVQGLGEEWMVGWFKADALKRVKSSNLPTHPLPLMVQDALDAFAVERKLKPATAANKKAIGWDEIKQPTSPMSSRELDESLARLAEETPASATESCRAQMSTSAQLLHSAEKSGMEIALSKTIGRLLQTKELPDGIEQAVMIDLPNLMDGIRNSERIGHKEAIRVCTYIAAIRKRFYADDVAGWLESMNKEFGYQRRYCFVCLKVGTFLLETLLGISLGSAQRYALKESTAATLLKLDLRKLEIIAEIKPENLTRFVEMNPNLLEMGRDALAEKAMKFRATEADATPAEKKKAAALERAEERAEAKKQPSYQIGKSLQTLVKLEAHIGDDDKLDTGLAFRASFHLQQAALNRLESEPATNEELASIRDTLQQEIELVEKLMGR